MNLGERGKREGWNGKLEKHKNKVSLANETALLSLFSLLRTLIRDLLAQRAPLYAQADVRVTLIHEEVPDRVTTRVLEAIAAALKPEAKVPTNPDHFEQN